MTITYNGKEYEMNTTLRLAYKLQNENGHRPYIDVISSIGEATLEDQIGMLYISFALANPEEAKFITKKVFLDYYLDNVTLEDMLEQLKGVIGLLLGKDVDELTEDDSGN